MAKHRGQFQKRRRVVYRTRKATRRRGRSSAGGGINLLHVGAAAAALSYIGTNTQMGANIAGKIPGNKTFGAGAALGITCLVLNMAKPNKWLKLAGVAGIVLAGSQLGVKGSSFSYIGDSGDVGALDSGFQPVDGVGEDDDEDEVGDYADDVGGEYED